MNKNSDTNIILNLLRKLDHAESSFKEANSYISCLHNEKEILLKEIEELRKTSKSDTGINSIPKRTLSTKLSTEDEITNPIINKNYTLPKEAKAQDCIYFECILPLKYTNFSKKDMLVISDLIHQINTIISDKE